MATSVLLVDDEAPIADSLARVLRAKEYEVLVATTGRQAIEIIASARPDVVLLDISLPDISGWEVIRLLQARGRHLPVITFSASALTHGRVPGFQLAGALVKPFSLDLAVRMIDQAAIPAGIWREAG